MQPCNTTEKRAIIRPLSLKNTAKHGTIFAIQLRMRDKMNIAICDDDSSERQALAGLLQQYGEENNIAITLCGYDSGEAFLSDYDTTMPVIVFLDIYMNGLSGVETAKQLRLTDEDVRIIFVTTSDVHYSNGFSVEATHYLVKPATYDQVAECMRRCKITISLEKTLKVKVRGKELSIPHKDIFYIEAVRNGTLIHHKGGSTKVYLPFSDIISGFSDDKFLRCHRAFMVNLDKVDRAVEDDFFMKNGEKVPIRQTDVAKLRAYYFNYFMNRLRGE